MKCLLVMGIVCCIGGALYGCGQKGPLVLPDAAKRKHPIPTLPAPPTPKSESSPPASPAPPATPVQPPSSTPAPQS